MKTIMKISMVSTFLISLSFFSQSQQINFVSIPGDESMDTFEMSESEITNEQYCNFLNEALESNDITYDEASQTVYNLEGLSMVYLGGTRVVKDHNSDGVYSLEEMENPLNRSFIEYNSTTNSFQVVDPEMVDWSIYFDPVLFPNVVDDITDWAELNPEGSGFYGEGDSDKLLPTLAEVKTWPVNHIRYYGAEEFAKYYGYDLPTKLQWRYAGQSGLNYQYATSDGSATEGIAWFNIDGPQTIHKGHVQPVTSKSPNPYGIYNLGGNVWEWCKDWYDGTTVFGGEPKLDEDFFIDDNISFETANGQYLKCLIGGSFNFFAATLGTTWNHAANMLTGNDHFGFRVCKNTSTNSINGITSELNFEVFPNPISNYFTINTNSTKEVFTQIHTSLGKLIFSEKVTGLKNIDVSSWEPGVYFVSINNQVKKIIIK